MQAVVGFKSERHPKCLLINIAELVELNLNSPTSNCGLKFWIRKIIKIYGPYKHCCFWNCETLELSKDLTIKISESTAADRGFIFINHI